MQGMKRIFLACFLALTLVVRGAVPPDRIEVGSLTRETGAHILVVYVVTNDAYQEVHLFWPDGHEQLVTVGSAIDARELDKVLQKIIDAGESIAALKENL
jgi:hypothetical protein